MLSSGGRKSGGSGSYHKDDEQVMQMMNDALTQKF